MRTTTAVLSAPRHPARRELADVGLLFLSGRYVPVGWVASGAGRRIVRRRGQKRISTEPEG